MRVPQELSSPRGRVAEAAYRADCADFGPRRSIEVDHRRSPLPDDVPSAGPPHSGFDIRGQLTPVGGSVHGQNPVRW
jgi:hypothetical protein